MIPSIDKPKYKGLVRLRTDVWNTLKTKQIKRKKWRTIIFYLKRKKKLSYAIINYEKKNLLHYPIYRRYRYQKSLFLRTHIKLLYGRVQDYKIKQISLRAKKQSFLGFAQELEQKATTFLYRTKLVSTYGEAKLHYKQKRILVNGSYKHIKIKKGDVLHFSPIYEKILRRRLYKNYCYFTKTKYGINQNIDFDVYSIRFLFLNNIKYFKNHPFRLPFERVMRWYTSV